jgi:hypothetical protein
MDTPWRYEARQQHTPVASRLSIRHGPAFPNALPECSMWACPELASGCRRRLSYAAYSHTGGFDFDLGAAAVVGFLIVST